MEKASVRLLVYNRDLNAEYFYYIKHLKPFYQNLYTQSERPFLGSLFKHCLIINIKSYKFLCKLKNINFTFRREFLAKKQDFSHPKSF